MDWFGQGVIKKRCFELKKESARGIRIVDHRQRDIGTSRLAFGLHFLCLDKLASHMSHTRQTLDTRLRAHPRRYNRRSRRSSDSRDNHQAHLHS